MCDATRSVGLIPQAAAAIGLIVLPVTRQPDDFTVAFKGQDMGGDAIEEPAIVAYDDDATTEGKNRIFERS